MAKKILVVDDDPEDLEAVESVLKNEGYEVIKANNGAGALDLLVDNEFDLILVDIQMPTLSGYDLLRLLREKLQHRIPIFYITIVPEKDVDMKDVEGFIQKPFTPEVFMKKIKEVLK